MLTENNKVNILRLFFEGPNVRLHLREVARRTGLSATGAMKILCALEKEWLLEIERTAFTVVYRGNYDNERFMALKRSLNLYSLYSCDIFEPRSGGAWRYISNVQEGKEYAFHGCAMKCPSLRELFN
jgi:hypothetical protein